MRTELIANTKTDQMATTDDADCQLTMSRFDSGGRAETYSEKKHDPGWRNRRQALD